MNQTSQKVKKIEKEEKELMAEADVAQDKVERALDRMARSGLRDYLDYLSSPRRIFFANFLAGIARGLGFLIGATVILSIVFFIIGKVLSRIPIIGQFFQWLDQFLQGSLHNGGNLLSGFM